MGSEVVGGAMMTASQRLQSARKYLGRLPALRADRRGVAAIEFAMIASTLCLLVLNVTDFGVYFYDRVQVNEAAQSGAQAAITKCGISNLPASTNCTGFTSAVTTAVQSTSLGTHVTLVSGYPSEAYYCVSSTGALQNVGAVTSAKPSNCSAAGVSTNTPGDWVEVQTTYTWTPFFPGLSVASSLPATITATAWMRLL